MKVSALDKIKHMISQMLNEEHDAHSDMINEISRRKPANINEILDSLSVVHNTREELLEQIMEKLKEMSR